MTVRRIQASLWPHTHDTTVTVVIEDTWGRKRVSGGVGRITLPIGLDDFHGEPMGVVLAALGQALSALGSPHPPEGGPAPLEGPQGGISGQLQFPLKLT